ncbi:ABC transporter substrate-binding protein [Glycomyces sp. NRRL B-16210]|uniref:ABC transporter substrate-binding protein n=1 Tax=Glycomyces sp. NRRL B-16210 TaxID=1463821 RepID=UPI0004C10D46|nr:extracellular solute-binding protein [Glycomyces sp. NRRL B-16210]
MYRRYGVKRRSLVTAVAAGTPAAIVLASCSQGSSSGGQDAGVVTLNGDRADFTDAYELAGAELEKITGYAIEPRNVPSTENYQQVVRSSLQTSSTTDLVKWWNGYRLQDLARSGGLADLSGQWDSAAEKGWVNPETRDSFSYDGKVYGIPMYKSYWVIFYNRLVFDEVGIAAPTTWDEFEDNNAKLRDAGVTPLFATQEAGWTSSIWFAEILSKLDPQFYTDLTAGEAKYTDATAQEAMRIWAGMYAEGYFTAADVAWDSEPSLLASGEVAQVPMGTWRNGTFAEAGLGEGEYSAFLLPPFDPATAPSVIVESGSISVAEKAPNKEAALETMANWLDPAVQRPWVENIKDTSANPQVTTDDPVLETVLEAVSEQEPTELVRYWEASPPALIEGGVQHLGAFMADPTESNIMPTLENLQSLADDEWARWDAGS